MLAYREHWGGKETPCKKLQEDDNHSMVNTGLTDSLRLDGDRETYSKLQYYLHCLILMIIKEFLKYE